MFRIVAFALFSCLLTFHGLSAFPSQQEIEKPCENCTTPATNTTSETETPTMQRRSTSDTEPAGDQSLLVVLEEDSPSESSEKVIVGEIVEEENNATLSSSEEVLNPEQIKRLKQSYILNL